MTNHTDGLDAAGVAKPCPYCGSKTKPTIFDFEGEPYVPGFEVRCDASGWEGMDERGCGATSGWGETRAEALANWNRRSALVDAPAGETQRERTTFGKQFFADVGRDPDKWVRALWVRTGNDVPSYTVLRDFFEAALASPTPSVAALQAEIERLKRMLVAVRDDAMRADNELCSAEASAELRLRMLTEANDELEAYRAAALEKLAPKE